MVTKITLIQALGANNFMILIAVIELTMLYPYIEYKLRVGIAMSDFMNGWVGLSIAGWRTMLPWDLSLCIFMIFSHLSVVINNTQIGLVVSYVDCRHCSSVALRTKLTGLLALTGSIGDNYAWTDRVLLGLTLIPQSHQSTGYNLQSFQICTNKLNKTFFLCCFRAQWYIRSKFECLKRQNTLVSM